MLLAGLSTGHLIGLIVVAAAFIAFALFSSFVAPKIWPDFPGKNGLAPFTIACFVMFAAMISAVAVFGRDAPEAKASESASAQTAAASVPVKEVEFKITVAKSVKAGKTTFVVTNAGKIQHNLAISGPGVKQTSTALINPGAKASLTVTLKKGTYTVWCTVPGHKAAGMVATVSAS
ncbi:MAG: hypothetical protein JO073_13180 [Actinobacteria bacterium]|nr:hypothetical protein [Actinomycetota bacterium]